jgi:RHS repeat-associated protein
VEDSAAHVGELRYEGASKHALTRAGDVELEVDVAGRTTRRGADAFRWDRAGRLTSVERDGDALLQREYGGHGELWREQSGARERFVFGSNYEIEDGIARLRVLVDGIAVVEEESAVLAATIVGDEDGDEKITAADAWRKSADDRGAALRSAARTMLLEDAGTARAYLHQDHLGSTIAVSDDDGAVTERFAYYPTGVVKHATAVQTEHASFTGHRIDEAGLIDLGARMLMAKEGRFLSADPTFLVLSPEAFEHAPDSFAGYAYAGNDPSSLLDFQGRFPWMKVLIGAGCVLGVAVAVLGIVTGIVPAMIAIGTAIAGAAAAMWAVATTTWAIATGIIGAVTSAYGEFKAQQTRLNLKYPGVKAPRGEILASTGYIFARAVTGFASGSLSLGASILPTAASDVVTIQCYKGKISPKKAMWAKIGLGVVGGAAGGVASVAGSIISGGAGVASVAVEAAAIGAAKGGAQAGVIEGAFVGWYGKEAAAIEVAQEVAAEQHRADDDFDISDAEPLDIEKPRKKPRKSLHRRRSSSASQVVIKIQSGKK